MTALIYEIPEILPLDILLGPLVDASAAVAFFDASVKNWARGEVLAGRLLFAEALACQHAQGDLVHMEDLVMLDGGVFNERPTGALSSAYYTLRTWRRAMKAEPRDILFSDRPGEIPVTGRASKTEAGPVGEAPCDPERLQQWQRIVRESRRFPPLLASAIVWDAWLTLLPDDSAGWRAALLAALVLKARGATTQFLLPIDTGRRVAHYHWDPTDSFESRIKGFLQWTTAGLAHARKELDRLKTVSQGLEIRIEGHRKNARLPKLVDLLFEAPLVSIPVACKRLKITKQAAQKLIPRLGSYVREVTGRQRNRAWTLT